MSSTKVRRGIYHRRCARCLWEGTYDTRAKADYAKSRHSCQKREQAMLAAARRQAREQAIDRTPQPCLHKQADHQHGTRACYVLDKCRCLPCSKANAEAETWRERQKAYGRYTKYVDAYPVRLHIQKLLDAGMGLKQIGKVASVSNGAMTKIWYGTYSTTGTGKAPGRKGRGGKGGELIRPPTRRVLRTTAEKLYAIDPDWTGQPLPLADGARVGPDICIGVTRRIRALVALGWSQSQLAARLGLQRSNFRLADHQWSLNWRTVKAVHALYDELSMTLPPGGHLAPTLRRLTGTPVRRRPRLGTAAGLGRRPDRRPRRDAFDRRRGADRMSTTTACVAESLGGAA